MFLGMTKPKPPSSMDDFMDRGVAIDMVRLWSRAIETQYYRAPQNEDDTEATEIELRFFISALRQWHRALVMLGKWEPKAQSIADTFGNQFGDFITMRDGLEHFDAFFREASKGHQKEVLFGRSVWWDQSGDQIELHVANTSIDLTQAFLATREAMDRFSKVVG